MVAALVFAMPATVTAAPAEGNPELSRAVGPEGMVLLKNDAGADGVQVLPLRATDKISVFGGAQINTVKGGTGSGDVNVPYNRNILYGIRQKVTAGKVGLDAATSAQYESSTGYAATDEFVLAAKESGANKAVVVLGRNSGEGGDRSAGKGDYYLSDAETALIGRVTANFADVVVVLNIGGVMDLTWVNSYPQIKSVLLAWQAGMEGGNAVADVLVGDKYPSGHLVDTFAKTYDDYPSSTASGIGMFGGNGDVYYSEDIYVGYRYFATADPAYEKVQYEFGYGLGYTRLDTVPAVRGAAPAYGPVAVEGDSIKVSATVTNAGAVHSGKEVVQVYFEGPDGALGKPARELAAFEKTDELAPGASQTLDISFPIDDLSSYDDLGVTGHKSCWVIEPGRYWVYVGNSVKNAVRVGYYDVGALIVTEEAHEYLTPSAGFDVLIDPVTGETRRNGPEVPPVIFAIANDKMSVVNAYEPAKRAAGISFPVGTSAGVPSVVGFETGAWLQYNITVSQAGTYYFSATYSNGNPTVADAFDIFLDENPVRLNAENIALPNTSASSMYQMKDTAKYLVTLPQGSHELRLVSKAGGNGYLNFLNFQPSWIENGVVAVNAATASKLVIADTHLENLIGTSVMETIPNGGGEKCIGAFQTNSTLTYKLIVAQENDYDITIDYANGNAAMTDSIRFYLSDSTENVTAARLETAPAAIEITQTASSGANRWYTFVDSEPYTVHLPAGTHYFTVQSRAGSAGNLRSLTFKPSAFAVSASRTTTIPAYLASTMSPEIVLETVPATGLPTVAFFNSGRVLTYKLNVERGGLYKFQLNYANGRATIADPFTITVNGNATTADGVATDIQVTMTQTGDGSGAGTWYNPAMSDEYLFDLPAGGVTLAFTAKTSSGNLNYFTLRPADLPDGLVAVSAAETTICPAYPPTSLAKTGSFAWENVPGTEDQCTGNFDTGTTITYTLDVAVAGAYSLVFRHANFAARANAVDVLIDGENAFTVSFPQTAPAGASGSALYYTFADSAPYPLALPAGRHTLTLVSKTTGAGNISALMFAPAPVANRAPVRAQAAPPTGGGSASGGGGPAQPDAVHGYTYDPADYTPLYHTDRENSIFNPEPNEGPTLMDVHNGSVTLDEFAQAFTLTEMAELSQGHGAGVPSGTGTLGGLDRLGVPALETADGPAGLRIDSATAWPIGTMLACTWNTPLLEQVGVAVATEMVANRVDIWLAPGMNIHRNPLCGRNFEYYSEDPLVTGKIAAALTRGVQTLDVGVTLKHYAVNNQEQNRNGGSNSVLTERAAREIYLKGFEIAIKEADPFCIMSSYNLMNGVETAERWDLITGIPTGEWGWRGIMMTDWGNGSNNAREAAAGNDIKMASGSPSTVSAAVAAGTLTEEQLRENMKDILYTTLRARKLFVANEIQVTPVPAVGTVRVEAEDFNEKTGAPQAEGGSGSGGRNLGYMDAGGTVTYYIDVARSGAYTFLFRYAGNSGSGGQFDIQVDGVTVSAFRGGLTGGWQNWVWAESPLAIPLTAGEHRLRFNITAGGGNVDCFDVARALTDISADDNYRIYPSAAEAEPGFYSPEFAIIRNDAASDGGVTLIAASYDAAGRLIGIDTTAVPAGTDGYTMAVAMLAKPENAARYQFFLWDGQNSPLTQLTSLGE
jgi:beta-glucosidase-like glycosyl hydrolase